MYMLGLQNVVIQQKVISNVFNIVTFILLKPLEKVAENKQNKSKINKQT